MKREILSVGQDGGVPMHSRWHRLWPGLRWRFRGLVGERSGLVEGVDYVNKYDGKDWITDADGYTKAERDAVDSGTV